MPFPLQVWLVHPEADACDAFRRRFAQLPDVKVMQSRFEELPPHDCFVTAGNAFGIMNAGIDAAVVQFHGDSLMQQVQTRLRDQYLGEQPVGTCFLQPTGNRDYPWVAHAPTMRVPGSIEGTDKVYSATWAAFIAVYRHNATNEEKIETLAFPAMGCGFGGVSYSESARQMAAAYEHYLHPPHSVDWDMVARRQRSICYDGSQQVVRG